MGSKKPDNSFNATLLLLLGITILITGFWHYYHNPTMGLAIICISLIPIMLGLNKASKIN
ncbi:MAG: hypothetical protein ACFFDP_10105 [Promethearchaeota archaeon]